MASFNEETVQSAIAAQQSAAHDPGDRVRTIAGPGTGKSHTIEERVCWLLDNGATPSEIAAVSFTRAASTDLQNRVQLACDSRGHEGSPAVSTLHSLALRALRAHGALVAYPVDPVVLDQWELRNLFDSEFGHKTGEGSIPRRRHIREDHEAFWSTGKHEIRPSQRPPDPPISYAERAAFRAFHVPRTQLYACVLPGEIVQLCVKLIDAGTLDPVDLLSISHLIVDEFQDLNPMDLRFVYAMAGQGASLFVAGDDDQSLYSFRYAFPEGIQRFTDEFPGAGDHSLLHCFRCTPAVLGSADSLIRSNAAPGRIPKDYVSLYADADPPIAGGLGTWKFDKAAQEAQAIARSCKRLIDAGMPAREIMVLLSNVRALGHELSDAFDQHGVPYEPPRETRFKDTQPGRALLAMLRIISRPDDYVALRTLLELRKGVGVGTAAGIADEAIAHHLNYRDLFYEELPQDVFSSRQEKALACGRAVTDALADWSADDLVEDRRAAVAEVLALILGHELDEQWTDEILALPEGATLAELSRFVGTEKADEEAAVVVAIRARMGETISLDEAMPPRVRVMTMHGAKGLSAQVVFIPGLEEEVLPGPARRRYPGQVLEAARMLYVSITRARLACVLSYAEARFMNGSMTSHTESRFTSDVGKAFEARPGGMAADLVRGIVALAARL